MFSRIGAAAYKPGLETSHNLDKFFGYPHRKFKSIHVAGTNGKGSTSHMLAAVLQCQGYKTALYTSPHLVDFRERMKINGKMIPQRDVIEFVEKWKAADYPGSPYFFELTMMMAFSWFAKEKVDFAVIEVGMGGRLDSTNIITPELCVITNISHDHNQFLGSSLSQIAAEKAGIIKQGIPVIIGEKQQESAPVFIQKAEGEGSHLEFAEDNDIIKEMTSLTDGRLKCETTLGSLILPLSGDYQKKNIKTVLSAIERLRSMGFEISDSSIKKGLEGVIELTGLRGRWTIISRHPLTIADTGHNLAGLTYNFNQLSDLMKERKNAVLRVVIGFVADKAIDKILNILPQNALYYVTNAKIPRALPAHELYLKFSDKGFVCKEYESVKTAYEKAKADASEQDIIFIGGSTFIVADFFQEVENTKN